MLKSVFQKTILVMAMLMLCVCVLPANAETVEIREWTSPTPYYLYSVFMVSATDGWAVGGSGTIIRYDGTEWSNVTSPTTETLNSMHMVSASDGWAVGIEGTIIRWDGTNWNTVTSPTTETLRSVHMVSASDGWAVGSGGTILRWTGTEWIPEFPTATFMPFLLILTLCVVVILTRTASKKRNPQLPSKTQL